MAQREPAICIRSTDFSETSQVLHFLTRSCGVVKLLAKGTKRPKSKSAGMIDLLAEGDLVFICGSATALGTLTEFTEAVPHRSLRKDIERLNAALYMIELTGSLLAEGDPHPDLFDLLHNALARLNQADSNPPAVLAYFQWRTLRIVGLLGDLTRCVCCGAVLVGDTTAAAGAGVYFSSEQGGLLCPACEGGVAEKHRVEPVAMAGLSALSAAGAGRRMPLPKDQAQAVNRILAYHVRQQLGKPLRMARHAIG